MRIAARRTLGEMYPHCREIVNESAQFVFALLGDTNPNVRVAGGQAAVHRAAQSGNAGVIAALLQCGRTQWDVRDDEGRTPRELAARGKHKEVLKLLDKAGVA